MVIDAVGHRPQETQISRRAAAIVESWCNGLIQSPIGDRVEGHHRVGIIGSGGQHSCQRQQNRARGQEEGFIEGEFHDNFPKVSLMFGSYLWPWNFGSYGE